MNRFGRKMVAGRGSRASVWARTLGAAALLAIAGGAVLAAGPLSARADVVCCDGKVERGSKSGISRRRDL